MSCRTNCCKKLSIIFALLAVVTLATPAFAGGPGTLPCPTGESCNCIQNEFNLQQGVSAQSIASSTAVGCTANDVRIAKVTNIRDLNGDVLGTGVCDTSNGPCCTQGSTFNFIADFQIVTTSTSARENIGMYIVTDGTQLSDTTSVQKSCADNIIPPPSDFASKTRPIVGDSTGFTCVGGTVKCGSNYYGESDPSPDNCGDTTSQDNGGAAGTQIVTLEIPNYTCVPPAGSTTLVLPNCTSWQVPGKTLNCVGTVGAQSYPTIGSLTGVPGGIPEAVPGDKSKCNCEVISLGVSVQTPTGTVLKQCTTSDSSGLNSTCSSGVEGQDEVTYTVTVTNTSNFGYITLTSLTDNVYGNIALGAACPTTGCTADSSGCSATGQQIAAQSSYTCTFTAHKYGDPSTATVMDTVTASGGSQFDGGWGPQTSSVTVTPTEATATASAVKSYVNTLAGCATVRYGVTVTNTTASTFDEIETLSALSDSAYGDLTTLHGSVLGTNCNQANWVHVTGDTSTAGTGGGAFGTLNPADTYSCQFDGQFCAPLVNTCFSQSDTATATLTEDEGGATVPVATTSNQVTVKECMTATPSTP